MDKQQIVIHPGMIESSLVFRRAQSFLEHDGFEVSYHACMRESSRGNRGDATVHIVHSAGYTCPALQGAKHVYLIAPPTSRKHTKAFFTKFWDDCTDSLKYREWGMFWYKNLLALWQLTMRYPYWRKMHKRFHPEHPQFPRHSLVILYPNDSWTRDYDWSKHDTVTLAGQHDEIIYRPKATMQAIFDNLAL